MTRISRAAARTSTGLLMLLFAAGPAFASLDTYEIKLFTLRSSSGLGSVTFDSGGRGVGEFDAASVADLNTTSGSPVGSTTFTNSSTTPVRVAMREVDYVDNKTNKNVIQGTFVQGLVGTMEGTATIRGRTLPVILEFRTDDPSACGKPTHCKTYEIKTTAGRVITAGNYSLDNVNTVPEPGTIAMLLGGLGALGAVRRWSGRQRRECTAGKFAS